MLAPPAPASDNPSDLSLQVSAFRLRAWHFAPGCYTLDASTFMLRSRPSLHASPEDAAAPSRPPRLQQSPRAGGFTIVEVMMAATILLVGFMGVISSVTISAEMMATARRQTLAAQILDQEIEKLRYLTWSNGSTGINDLLAGPTTLTIDSQFRKAWNSTTTYVVGESTCSNGVWYYCVAANTNRAVTNTSYWAKATSVQTGVMTDTNLAYGATYALSRTVAAVAGSTNLREITFTVTWTVVPSGQSISRTYTRMRSAYFGKFGLNLTFQKT